MVRQNNATSCSLWLVSRAAVALPAAGQFARRCQTHLRKPLSSKTPSTSDSCVRGSTCVRASLPPVSFWEFCESVVWSWCLDGVIPPPLVPSAVWKCPVFNDSLKNESNVLFYLVPPEQKWKLCLLTCWRHIQIFVAVTPRNTESSLRLQKQISEGRLWSPQLWPAAVDGLWPVYSSLQFMLCDELQFLCAVALLQWTFYTRALFYILFFKSTHLWYFLSYIRYCQCGTRLRSPLISHRRCAFLSNSAPLWWLKRLPCPLSYLSSRLAVWRWLCCANLEGIGTSRFLLKSDWRVNYKWQTTVDPVVKETRRWN